VRIGVLTTSYPRHEGDAAGAFVAGFCRWLAARVGDVDVVCADGARPLFAGAGAPALLAGPAAFARWREAAAFSTRLMAAGLGRARGWDAVVSHWLVPSAAVGAACARGRRHLAIAHGSDVRLLRRLPGGRSFVRALARRADLVYVAEALHIDGAPGRVLPMAIDVAPIVAGSDAAARAQARQAWAVDGFVVAFLGRLIFDKGCDLLIDALPAGATLLVAGAGPQRMALEQQARGRSVRFLGQLAGTEKLGLLAAADVLAIPSRVDGSPTVALEGLAAGLPMVATRAGGLPELLTDDVAVFADASPPSLHAALTALMTDDPRRSAMASAARLRAPRYDWSAVGPRLWGDPGRACDGCVRVFPV
jgi:glycosyltransferase involved in cell wall biosynthesis